ncbi:molybdopterin oxidoreductase family protein [Humisphaera borealis]|uniref:Nitrate reductase n=1 Tax=Humisphaera borealis TaxID=2807512 RepID=A0A7M2WXN8_9BACT|nr:nitrate reductase [Humisphaera borealis]QOV89561.1 nitrate reductase [Humisphaera borealis]
MAKEIPTLCPYCGVGCGLLASTDGERILRIRGDPKHPANLGRVCPKGGTVAATVNVATRLRHAMLRDGFGKAPSVVPPGAAIRVAAEGIDRILQSHGPGAIAFYLSGQLTTEAQYIATKFAKAYLRTNHCDSNSRLCMASAGAGMKLSLGSDGPPTVYADIELADAFFFIGSNAAECHPVTFERIRKRIDKGARCVVADPRRTPTAESATVHLPIRPGTDLTLLNGLMRIIRDRGLLDARYIEQHTEGWEQLDAILDDYPLNVVAQRCGLEEADILSAAEIIAYTPKLITFWTMGINQSLQGTFASNAIINLHLATGRIGKPGAGPFSLTGQPNAMGGRDVGYMSHMLPGQRSVASEKDRADMEAVWGLKPGTIVSEVGHDAVRMFDAIDRGEIKALWVIGSNPAASMPNLPRIRSALEKCELVIVQDAYYPTETTKYAHVLLPAAVNLEQEGTYCNSERRVTLMEQVVPPPGDAKPDWWWVREIAVALGFRKGMQFESSEQIFDEFARSTAGRPNDQSGMHYKMLRELGPQLWPHPSMARANDRRYVDGIYPTATGKARLWARHDISPDEKPNADFPMLLTTGRVLNQWHTRTKTGQVEQLNALDPAPYLQIHPQDADELGLSTGDEVTISSRRGTARAPVLTDDTISPGVVFMPIHWNELWAQAASPNEATSDQTDPVSFQPALKCCAVKVAKVACRATAGSRQAAVTA